MQKVSLELMKYTPQSAVEQKSSVFHEITWILGGVSIKNMLGVVGLFKGAGQKPLYNVVFLGQGAHLALEHWYVTLQPKWIFLELYGSTII